MHGASHSDGFTEMESFSLGAGAVVAADSARLLLGTTGGRLEIRTADGDSETLDVDGGLEDVAIDGYVFTVADGAVTAYTTSGIELWSTPVTDPQRIVPAGKDGVLACVTGDGRLVGIDTETGNELYSVQRPHSDVTAERTVVGGHGRVIIASWSFLVAFDTNGEVLFDRNIEGAIEDVASLADGVVVRLKNGQLLRVDEAGDRQWAQATDASAIAAYGDGAVLSVDSDGVSRIDEHGNETPLSVPSAESVLATGDGRLLVTTANRTQTVYRKGKPAEANLSATVETSTVESGERIRVTVDNDGEEAVDGSATLGVEPVDALRLRRTDAALSVPGSGSTALEFHVTEVIEPGDVTVELSVDGSPVGSDTITVATQRDLAEAVDVSATVDSVESDGATVTVTATNTSEAPVHVGVASADRAVDPGETVSFQTTVARDETTLSVTVSGDDETVEIPVEVPVDGGASLAVEAAGSRSSPYFDVVVGNEFDTTLTGTLSVTVGAGEMRLDRSIALEPAGTLRLAVLLTAEFVADGLDVTAAVEGVTETAASLDASAWEPDSETSVSDAATAGRSLPATGSSQEQPTVDETTQGAGTETEARDGAVATTAPALDVDRATPESVRRGERFAERIEITNTGTAAATDVRVTVGDAEYSVGDVAPDGTIEAVRFHAVFETGPFPVPAGRVTTAAGTVEIAERTVSVTSGDVEVAVHTTTADGRTTLEYRVQNRTEQPCRLLALGVKSPEMASDSWQLDGETVAGGDERTFERAVGHDGAAPATVLAGCQYQFPESDRATYWTVAREESADAGAAAPERDVTVDADAGSVPLAGRNSAIDCAVTFGESLTDVTVEATGEIVSPLFVGERDVGAVDAGESLTQAVDILPDDAGTASFDLLITGKGADGAIERRYTVTGPVAATESESVSGAWHAECPDETDAESAAPGPTHLVTTFRS